ncbi:MAG: heme exporter protein CcmB [Pseudomonadota bacterium]
MRELSLAWSGGGGAALPLGFFAGAAMLTPLALGPAPELLRAAGPGVLFIALSLSSLLPMERLFQADLEDGTLETLASSDVGLESVALAKVFAHWTATGLPLALLSPVLWLMLQGSEAALGYVLLASVIAGLAFFAIGAIGAALAAGVRRGGLLIALIALPLYAPAMIFSASAVYAAADGRSPVASLMLAGASAMAALAVSPFASAAALRTALD